MDVTEKYCDMCREATEITSNHQWQNGDVVLGNGYVFVHCDYCQHGNYRHDTIWLPRQDQLQDMIHDWKCSQHKFSGNYGLMMDFVYWVDDESNLPCASFEQLWLAYIQKELHDKVWNNEKKNWVKNAMGYKSGRPAKRWHREKD